MSIPETTSLLPHRWFSPFFAGTLALVLLGAIGGAKPAVLTGFILLVIATLVDRRQISALWTAIKADRLSLTLLLVAVILPLLSALWAIAPEAALKGSLRSLALLGGGIILFAAVRTAPPLGSRAQATLIGTSLLTLLVFAVLCTFGVSTQRFFGNDSSPLSDMSKGIGVATFVLPVVATLALCGAHRRWGWATIGLALVLSVPIHAYSAAQSALLSLVGIGIAAVMPVNKAWFWRLLRAVVVGGVMAAPLIPEAIFPTANDVSQVNWLARASAAQRLELWQSISHKIMERPVLGYGYEGTRYTPHFDTAEIFQPGDTYTHPHNMALQFWMEYGVAGALIGAALLWWVLRRIEQVDDIRVRRLYLMTFFGLFSVSLVGWGMWQGWWIAWVCILTAANILVARSLPPRQGETVLGNNTQ